MADNIDVTPGTGKTIAADDVSSVYYQVVKLDIGGNGVSSPVTDIATSAKQDTGNTSIASIDTKTPSLGQALAAASRPVVLTAAQITTLTPPAAITGYATEVTLSAINAKLPSLGQALAAASIPIVLTSAQISTLTPLSTVAATQSGTWNVGTVTTLSTITNVVHVDDNSGSLTVDGTVTANMGTVTADPFGANADAASATGSISAKLRFIASTGIPITGTVTVGSHAVTNAGTFAVQSTLQTQTDTVMIGGVNIKEINAVTPLMGNGITGTGSLRVTVASDNTAFAVNATLSAETTKVLGVVRTADGSGNLLTATSNALDINLKTIAGSLTLSTVTTVSTVTNLSQLGGAAIAMGTGTRSAGTQRVTIATDDVVPASQSGTWTLQPGNTANTTPWLVTQTPKVSGGLSTFHLVAAATTNATNVKASAGQVFGWFIYNSNAAARKVVFHNSAGTPTAGAAVFFSVMIPPLAGANVEYTNGIAFSTGIAITTVTGLADNDSAAVALNDLTINIFYA